MGRYKLDLSANGAMPPPNGAMDEPLPAKAYSGRDMDIPEGYMVTPAGLVPCIGGDEDQVDAAEVRGGG